MKADQILLKMLINSVIISPNMIIYMQKNKYNNPFEIFTLNLEDFTVATFTIFHSFLILPHFINYNLGCFIEKLSYPKK